MAVPVIEKAESRAPIATEPQPLEKEFTPMAIDPAFEAVAPIPNARAFGPDAIV